VKANSEVYLCASWGPFDPQNVALHDQTSKTENIRLSLIITEPKKAHFFACKLTGFVHQGLRDFVKMTLTRVESLCEKRESSHHFSQRDSSRVQVTKNCDSSRVIDSSHAITGYLSKSFLHSIAVDH